MSSDYYCPNCKSENVMVYDNHIECIDCGRSFSRKTLDSGMDDESIISNQELEGFLDPFDEFEDEETRRRFLESLDEDLEDLDEEGDEDDED